MSKRYVPEMVRNKDNTYYIIQDTNDYSAVATASKYLVHQIKVNKSPNTVRQSAFAISYYCNFLDNNSLTVSDIVRMPYVEQYEHFCGFLQWLKNGMHRKGARKTGNNTCNIYLRAVFAWYAYLAAESRQMQLQVTQDTTRYTSNSIGVGLQIKGKSFPGYLRGQDRRAKAISQDDIRKLVEAAPNIRDKLLILLLADTGARIGEILGIRYTQDIDFSRQAINVCYREQNANNSRAKNAENRMLYLSDSTFDLLELYLVQYRQLLVHTDYLFVVLEGDTAGEPLKAGAVYALLKRLETQTNIHTTPHQFRRYFANARRRAKWELEEIACAMGHRNLSTTNQYFIIDEDEKEAANKKYFDSVEPMYDVKSLL